ncbi:MAG TPA: helix-turn-helix domain-containing protein [Thermoanaerobaculia bacterium]|nr:helix-turn-helix domain-containing protein [Thermoanaerobaculia bacterium]
MFEPLGDVIRLRRLQRNLTQERLAKMAGVSRRQLSLLEDGRNVSLLFLTKIAAALELTELPVGGLRLRSSQPELATIVRAADVLERLKQSLPTWISAAGEITSAAASLDEMLGRALAAGVSVREIEHAAERLASLPAEEQEAAGETLRSLASREPAVRMPRPRPAAKPAARRRGR